MYGRNSEKQHQLSNRKGENYKYLAMDRESLSEWAKDKPLSILQLDPADRAVLRIAGM